MFSWKPCILQGQSIRNPKKWKPLILMRIVLFTAPALAKAIKKNAHERLARISWLVRKLTIKRSTWSSNIGAHLLATRCHHSDDCCPCCLPPLGIECAAWIDCTRRSVRTRRTAWLSWRKHIPAFCSDSRSCAATEVCRQLSIACKRHRKARHGVMCVCVFISLQYDASWSMQWLF